MIVQGVGWTMILDISRKTHNSLEPAVIHLETLMAEEVEGAQAVIMATED